MTKKEVKKNGFDNILFLVILGLLFIYMFSYSPTTESDNPIKKDNNKQIYESNTPVYQSNKMSCSETRSMCNEALGEYALYKAKEDTYTKYESNIEIYNQIISRYEDEIFPRCKELLSECN